MNRTPTEFGSNDAAGTPLPTDSTEYSTVRTVSPCLLVTSKMKITQPATISPKVTARRLTTRYLFVLVMAANDCFSGVGGGSSSCAPSSSCRTRGELDASSASLYVTRRCFDRMTAPPVRLSIVARTKPKNPHYNTQLTC